MQYFIWDGKTKTKKRLFDINIQVTIEIFQEWSLFHKQYFEMDFLRLDLLKLSKKKLCKALSKITIYK